MKPVSVMTGIFATLPRDNGDRKGTLKTGRPLLGVTGNKPTRVEVGGIWFVSADQEPGTLSTARARWLPVNANR